MLVLTSWSLGLIAAGVILRYGLGAEELAWSLAFLLLPLCCVYYPVSVLPDWLQPVALALPPTHVFEGMRSILLHGMFDATELWWALGLNAVYLIVRLSRPSAGSCERARSTARCCNSVNKCDAACSLSSLPASSSARLAAPRLWS